MYCTQPWRGYLLGCSLCRQDLQHGGPCIFVKTTVSTKLVFHITVNKHLGQKEKHKLEDLNTDGGDGVDHDKTILGERNWRNFVLNM
jgi:hypothetical protein